MRTEYNWWLIAEGAAFLALIVWTNRMSYRHGIWDGAFNHFLPIVRREMRRYNAARAKAILEAEQIELENSDE